MSNPNTKMAVGTVLPKRSPNAIDYLDNVRDYNNTKTQDIKKQIELSRKLYTFDGILATAIDILTEFPTTDFYVENVKNKRCEYILKYFIEEVNKDNPNTLKGLQRVARQIANSVFIDGNAFPYETWSLITDPHNKKIKNKKLPMKITILNPLSITIPKEFIEFGQKRILFRINKDLLTLLKKRVKTERDKELLKFVPPSIIQEIEKNPTWGGEIELDNKYVTHLKRKSQDYEVWGKPYLTRVFSIAASKQRLRALDDATTEGLVNFITVFKIGDKDDPQTCSQTRLQAFANLLRNPAASNTLVWTYDIDFITVGPKGDVLNFKDKYGQVNYDLIAALGMPEILFTGQGSQAGVWTAVLAMLERLEKFRDDLKTYFEDMLRRICIDNGFPNEFPKIRWARMRLRDERAAKNIVMALYDRGILPIRTTLNELNYDYDTLRTLRKQEHTDKDEEIFTRRDVPWGTKGDENKSDNPADNQEKEKTDKEPGANEDGRPVEKNKDVFVDAFKQLVANRFEILKEDISNAKEDEDDIPSTIYFAYILIERDIKNAIEAVYDAKDFIDQNVDSRELFDNLEDETLEKLESIRNGMIAEVSKLSGIIKDGEELKSAIGTILDEKAKEVDSLIGELDEFFTLVTIKGD